MRNSILNRIGLAAIVGCVAVGALVLAGCGGDDDTTTTAGATGATGAQGSAPLSEEEFTSQGNEICAEANDQIEALQLPGGDEPVSALAPVFDEGVQIQNETYDKMAALTPPDDLKAKFDSLLAQGRAAIALTERAAKAAEAEDTAEVRALIEQSNEQETRSNALARSLGLDECAKDVQPQTG